MNLNLRSERKREREKEKKRKKIDCLHSAGRFDGRKYLRSFNEFVENEDTLDVEISCLRPSSSLAMCVSPRKYHAPAKGI